MEPQLKENISQIPKKRGRKPKPKEIEEPQDDCPKKRGRKPKPKHPFELLPKVPKKRGRKPKDKYGVGLNNNKQVHINTTKENENIILHLPIHTVQLLNNDFVERSLLKYNPDISIPTPYEEFEDTNPFSNNYATASFDKHEIIQDVSSNDDCSNITEYSVPDDDSEKSIGSTFKQMFLKYEDDNLFHKTSENNVMECNYDTDNLKIKVNSCSNNQSSKNSMIQFKEANNRNKWPETTEIKCWWCCSGFNNVPCCLPLKKKEEHYVVIGCFCSPECAASWNFYDYGDNKIWESYSLLNLLYRKTFENNIVNIKLAPPRQCLKMFGGTLSIDEFRKSNLNYNKTHKIIMPPMTSIIPQIEETSNNSFCNKNKSFIPIDKDRIEKANKDLKLKRNKPLPDQKNTLENCMQLKYNN